MCEYLLSQTYYVIKQELHIVYIDVHNIDVHKRWEKCLCFMI